jgi:cytochrome d ubiquinol oxidase subunit I
MLDPVLLARIQFAFTVSFHIVFPAFTIGLASYLAVLEGLWLWTADDSYRRAFDFWLKIFAVAFGMGVVSGVFMSYQFGTNWSVFSDKTGPVLGPLMGYEVLTAFFLEAGFLGIMLFGRERVGRRMHFFATLMVAGGTLFSAFWILAVNSWMHTPQGYAINAAGQFVPRDWWAVIFNPSFPYRLVHMVLAAYLATAFIVGATGAYHLLRGRRDGAAQTMLSMAMWMAALVTPLQVIAGDLHGLNTFEHQPAKVAAMEGHFRTYEKGAPLILFGIPDTEAGETRYSIEIPKLGSLILTHSMDGRVRGLDAWPRSEWPNVPIVFWCFRIMVGLGVLMLAVGIASLVLRMRGRLFEARWFLQATLLMGPSGLIAMLAGWFVTEVGRQPYTVYGLLRTADSVSPIGTPAVGASLLAIVVVYLFVFGAGVWYLLKLMARPPDEPAPVSALADATHAAGITPAAGLPARERQH